MWYKTIRKSKTKKNNKLILKKNPKDIIKETYNICSYINTFYYDKSLNLDLLCSINHTNSTLTTYNYIMKTHLNEIFNNSTENSKDIYNKSNEASLQTLNRYFNKDEEVDDWFNQDNPYNNISKSTIKKTPIEPIQNNLYRSYKKNNYKQIASRYSISKTPTKYNNSKISRLMEEKMRLQQYRRNVEILNRSLDRKKSNIIKKNDNDYQRKENYKKNIKISYLDYKSNLDENDKIKESNISTDYNNKEDKQKRNELVNTIKVLKQKKKELQKYIVNSEKGKKQV